MSDDTKPWDKFYAETKPFCNTFCNPLLPNGMPNFMYSQEACGNPSALCNTFDMAGQNFKATTSLMQKNPMAAVWASAAAAGYHPPGVMGYAQFPGAAYQGYQGYSGYPHQGYQGYPQQSYGKKGKGRRGRSQEQYEQPPPYPTPSYPYSPLMPFAGFPQMGMGMGYQQQYPQYPNQTGSMDFINNPMVTAWRRAQIFSQLTEKKD